MNISVKVEGNLAGLNQALEAYAEATGKTPAAVLDQKGAFLSQALFKRFQAIQPARGAITAAARGRGWTMGRKENAIKGISKTAWLRAERMLGGKGSVLINEAGKVVLVGARGALVANKRRGAHHARADEIYRIYGATTGIHSNARIGSRSLYASALGLRVLGRRALAVKLEANLRESGRNFLGVSWLHERWKKVSGADPRSAQNAFRVLVNNNPRSKFVSPLGTMELGKAGDTGAFLQLVSNVPGMEATASQSVIARVLQEETDDTNGYLMRYQIENFSRELRKFVKS